MKRIILAISVLLVFGLAAVGVVYNRGAIAETAMASCCCMAGQSCPMKKNADGTETGSCCSDGCCKDGSCSMKGTTTAADVPHPENCPMMKDKQAHDPSHADMTQGNHANEASCCCSCCGGKKAD